MRTAVTRIVRTPPSRKTQSLAQAIAVVTQRVVQNNVDVALNCLLLLENTPGLDTVDKDTGVSFREILSGAQQSLRELGDI